VVRGGGGKRRGGKGAKAVRWCLYVFLPPWPRLLRTGRRERGEGEFEGKKRKKGGEASPETSPSPFPFPSLRRAATQAAGKKKEGEVLEEKKGGKKRGGKKKGCALFPSSCSLSCRSVRGEGGGKREGERKKGRKVLFHHFFPLRTRPAAAETNRGGKRGEKSPGRRRMGKRGKIPSLSTQQLIRIKYIYLPSLCRRRKERRGREGKKKEERKLLAEYLPSRFTFTTCSGSKDERKEGGRKRKSFSKGGEEEEREEPPPVQPFLSSTSSFLSAARA